jgi:hypothetical protein
LLSNFRAMFLPSRSRDRLTRTSREAGEMIGRRSIIGAFVLCAFALSAFGAAGAQAEGRYYMCEKNEAAGKEQFSDAHCVVAAEGNGGFKHVEITNGTFQEYVATNAKTAKETTAAQPTTLKSTLAGVETEIECTGSSGEGKVINAETSASGTGTLAYTGCTVTKPAGKGCKITEGGFKTEPLASTTAGQPANSIKVSPKSGETFVTIPISGCSIEALNNKFPVTGSVVTTASGATVTSTEAAVTALGTLKLGGTKAGIGGAQTVSTPLGLFAFALT